VAADKREEDKVDLAQTTGTDSPISMRQLLEAGVHFGHQTKRWNPKMRPYIFGARNGIHIIDLQHTVRLFRRAYDFVVDISSRGETILFVGTKKQAQDVIVEEAARSGNHSVTQRWLGGTLTNFRTVKQSLDRMRSIEKMAEDGTFDRMSKKEVLMLQREHDKLEKSLGGLKTMSKLPGAIFIVDPHKEHIAVAEARKLEIPIIAVTDTNCDPDVVDYVIPGNDDAIRAVKLFAAKIADAALLGQRLARERGVGRREDDDVKEHVIHVTSGGDGPRVEVAARGRRVAEPEASANPDSSDSN
jgi:small subunit ribosomal protein S2